MSNLLIILTAFLVLTLVVLMARFRWWFAAWILGLPKPSFSSIRIIYDVIIPMRDGVRLVADVYRPKVTGKYPAILIRTPYEKGEKEHQMPFIGRLFASQGYVCIIQDTRGKHQSEGDFYPFAHEDADGCDTVEWLASQEWCDGNVGMFGVSYLGLTQWLSAPLQGNALKAMAPIFISTRAYDIVRGNHGVLHFRDILVWQYKNVYRQKRDEAGVDWDRVIWHLPVISADEVAGEKIAGYKDWVQHSEKDGYWGQWRADNKMAHIRAPALILAGWFDRFVESGFEDYLRMRATAGSQEARCSRLIVGPWIHEATTGYPDMKLGRQALGRMQLKEIIRWFDRWTKGIDNGIDREDPIKIFVMGINQWRSEKEWPLARTEYTEFFLHSGGNANTRNGDGLLTMEPPSDEASDRFEYDPKDPVPTMGGNSVYKGKVFSGPLDQKPVDGRDDVLVYTTPTLEANLEVTGPVKLVLYAASSAPDTDFTAKLVDVYPDGKALYVKSGIVRARYRNSLREPELLVPGEITRFEIEIGPTSLVFLKGHRIRLQVSSSNFPEYSRNLNTEEDPHHSVKIAVAQQTIYHDSQCPSHLVLPVIPSDP